MCPDGGTGRRAGLKIRFSQESGSSTLPLGTIFMQQQPVSSWIRFIITQKLLRMVFGKLRMTRVVGFLTTPYSGGRVRKPLDMMWGLAYSSPEFAMEYL